MVTAASVIVALIAIGIGVDLMTTAAMLLLSLPIIAALGRIAPPPAPRRAEPGRVPGSLPLIFLTAALAQPACGIAIGVQLAFAG